MKTSELQKIIEESIKGMLSESISESWKTNNINLLRTAIGDKKLSIRESQGVYAVGYEQPNGSFTDASGYMPKKLLDMWIRGYIAGANRKRNFSGK